MNAKRWRRLLRRAAQKMTMGRSREKREASWREHLAKLKAKRERIRQNPVRSVMALPPGINLDDIMWSPDHLELVADVLARMKARWTREDDERRRKRLAEIMVALERDKVLLRLAAEQERRLAQIQEYYRIEHEKEAEAGDKRRRQELAKISKRINQD